MDNQTPLNDTFYDQAIVTAICNLFARGHFIDKQTGELEADRLFRLLSDLLNEPTAHLYSLMERAYALWREAQSTTSTK